MAEPLLPGDPRQLGAFYLDGRLGAGGQGVVYEGYGPDGRRVAVKALHNVNDDLRGLLRKEVWAWRMVAPFCTTKVIHADLDGPAPYVVSEHVAGPNLREAVSSGPYGPEELRRLAIGVATALVAIHRAKVVHRDLKPENILLAADGPRVIDFGIARIEELPTTTGVVKGTLRYMPPERYRGQNGDAKIDVWAWGAVVLFAATGRPAFDGTTVPALSHQIATAEPDTSMLDEPLRSLVSAALSKDPADRPTAEDLLLGLAGGADLAEAAGKAVPARAPVAGPRSRAELAEAVFAGLGPEGWETVPRVFLRLVTPGERAEDTLRSARGTEFTDGQAGAHVVERVLRDFTDAGVLVWDGEAVTLASAALIRAWPRLRAWVEAERGGLDVHLGLTGASRLWDDHGRKASDLYQGTALARAQSWAVTGRRHLTLNLVERAFLDAAAALARRRGRFRTLLSAVLAILLVVAIGAATVALDQRQTVVSQRDRAASAQIAGLSQSLRRAQPDTARRLAVAAWSIAGTPEAWSALAAVRHQVENRAARIPDFEVTMSDLDGDGAALVAAGGSRVGLWDVDTGRRLGSYTAPAEVHRLDISDDGKAVAVHTENGRITVLDAPGLRPRGGPGHPAALRPGLDDRTLLSPKGTYLVATGTSGGGRGVTVWDTRTGRPVIERTQDSFLQPSFSPQETILSLTSADRITWVDPRTGADIDVPDFRTEDHNLTGPVQFSPDGQRGAVRTKEGARVVQLAEGGDYEKKSEVDHSVAELHFSHDGEFIASRFTLWEVEQHSHGGLLMRYPTSSDECSEGTFRFSADDTELRCVSSDGVLHSLDITRYTNPPTRRLKALSKYQAVSASHDGSTLALANDAGGVEIWSTMPLRRRFEVTPTGRFGADGLELSRDGRLLAVGNDSADDRAEIWDLAKRTRIGVLPASPAPSQRQLIFDPEAAAFSPDNKSFARLQHEKGTNFVEFWDLTTMKVIRKVAAPAGLSWVDFRPDGKAVLATPTPGLIDFPSGKVVQKAPAGLYANRFSADGRTLYEGPGASAGTLSSFDARTLRRKGDELSTGELAAYSDTFPLAHSSDGRLIATAHGEALGEVQIKLWDLRTRTQLGITLTGLKRDSQVLAMVFTPDDSSLISVDPRGVFHTYSIGPRLLVAELCKKSGGLGEAEWETRIPDVPYRDTC